LDTKQKANETRIETLETDNTSNKTRIGNLETSLNFKADNKAVNDLNKEVAKKVDQTTFETSQTNQDTKINANKDVVDTKLNSTNVAVSNVESGLSVNMRLVNQPDPDHKGYTKRTSSYTLDYDYLKNKPLKTKLDELETKVESGSTVNLYDYRTNPDNPEQVPPTDHIKTMFGKLTANKVNQEIKMSYGVDLSRMATEELLVYLITIEMARNRIDKLPISTRANNGIGNLVLDGVYDRINDINHAEN